MKIEFVKLMCKSYSIIYKTANILQETVNPEVMFEWKPNLTQ